MALATRCPQCGTTFKVAHDQLKLRAGMVRCGACKQVFNGIEHLVRNHADEVLAVPATAASTPVASAAHEISTPTPIVTPAPTAKPIATPSAIPTAPIATPAPTVAPIVVPTPVATPAPTNPPAPSATPGLAPIASAPAPLAVPIVAPKLTPAPTQAPVLELVPTAAPAPTEWPTLVTDSMLVHEEIIAVPHEDFDEDFDLSPTAVTPAPAIAAESESGVTVHTDLHLDPIAAVQEAQQERLQEAQVEFVQTPAPVATPAPLKHEAMPHSDAALAPQLRKEPKFDEDLSAVHPEPQEHHAEPLAHVDHADEVPPHSAATADAVESDAEEPEFVIQGRKRQGMRRVVHMLLVLLTFVLFFGALGQATYVFRSQLAVIAPPAKPWLEKGCQVLGCQVGFPSQIKAVALESDELQVLPHTRNVYVLSTLLRNHSNTVQSWPHIELSLNDANSKALARRVFSPREYLVNPPDEARGFVAHGEQPVKLYFEVQEIKASGYGVYLFYP